jgi:hypothetical protein
MTMADNIGIQEEKEEKTEGEKETNANSNNGNEGEGPQDIVESAKRAADDIRKGLAERVKILEREEKLFAKQEALRQLGGGSYAGNRPEKKEETPKEYAERVMRGEI